MAFDREQRPSQSGSGPSMNGCLSFLEISDLLFIEFDDILVF